jgi:hypothetical protein
MAGVVEAVVGKGDEAGLLDMQHLVGGGGDACPRADTGCLQAVFEIQVIELGHPPRLDVLHQHADVQICAVTGG